MPHFGNQILQPHLAARRVGTRFQANTLLPGRLAALYGVDASVERTSQTVSIIDGPLFEQSGGLTIRALGQRSWVPETAVDDLAPFLQLTWAATGWLALRAGARHQLLRLRVADYDTLAGSPVGGGDRRSGETLVHAGAVLGDPGALSGFASVTQGLALPDVGLILGLAPGGSTLATLDVAPQRVNAYEVGLRHEGGPLGATLAIFYSTSDRGERAAGPELPAPRGPDRAYGIESTVRLRLGQTWRAGATLSFVEGQRAPIGGDPERFLDGYRIPPLKVSAQIGKRLLPGLDVRLSGLYSGGRDRFGGSIRFGERPIERFLLVDLLATAEVGPGRLRLALSNLLDRQYTPIASQLLWSGSNRTRAAGTGLQASLAYAFTY